MTRRSRCALLGAVAIALGCSGCGRVAGEGSRRLKLEAPRWWFSYLPLRLVATPKGVLVDQRFSLSVFAGPSLIGQREMDGEAITIWIPGRQVTGETATIAIKTGSERTIANIKVVSIGWLLTIGALLIATIVGSIRELRRRRARRAPSAVDPPI